MCTYRNDAKHDLLIIDAETGLSASIYEKETRAVLLYTFSPTRHSTHNCRDSGMRNTGKCKSLDESNISRGWGGGVYALFHRCRNVCKNFQIIISIT
jgi:hypothetical protein